MPTTTPSRKGARGSRGGGRVLLLTLVLFAGLLVAAGAGLWLVGSPPGAAADASVGGPFKLTEGDGKTVTDQDLHGKYTLIYFGYTVCPDVCPTTLQSVAAALDKLGSKAGGLQPVFITVDPQRDTPKAVADYVYAFSPRLIGLSGTPEEIGAVEKEYHVYAAIHRTGPGKDDYTVDHSSVLYLMGPDGKFVAPLRADAKPDELAADLSRYLG